MSTRELPSRPATKIDGNNSITKVVRSRKSKGRSKKGCLTCKQKRVKCDERWPICSNCSDQSRTCVYDSVKRTKAWQDSVTTFSVAEPEPAKLSQTDSQIAISSAKKILHVPLKVPFQWNCIYDASDTSYAASTSSESTLIVNSPPQPMSFQNAYDALDSELLSHFISMTSYDLLDHRDVWVERVVPLGFRYEFLMHAILMAAASHLEKISPHPKKYRLRATFHLYHALASYREILRRADFLAYSDALIATSFLLVIHAAANYIFDPLNPSEDKLVSLGIGIRTIVMHVRFEVGITIFKRVLSHPLSLPPRDPTSGPAMLLIAMVDENRERYESDGRYDEYMRIIRGVTPMMESATNYVDLSDIDHDLLMDHFIRWPSFTTNEFAALVEVHDPVALVIMAHFYAALDYVRKRSATRRWWYYEERPWSFCSQIFVHLGSRYAKYMAWPLDTIAKGEESEFIEAGRSKTPIHMGWDTTISF